MINFSRGCFCKASAKGAACLPYLRLASAQHELSFVNLRVCSQGCLRLAACAGPSVSAHVCMHTCARGGGRAAARVSYA